MLTNLALLTHVILGLDPRNRAAPAAANDRVKLDHDGGGVGGFCRQRELAQQAPASF
ncbi:protein of unknown function [Shinella sp. WSC3-e]|nr:hypothetical protein SHINE37_40741 [Rhizobiaceae bacterium]CAK7255414.1 protein of unknown function [Shinella sp. WSC3-e]